jgi:hypothetical protein
MKIKNIIFISLGGENITTGVTCSNSTLLMAAVCIGWA